MTRGGLSWSRTSSSSARPSDSSACRVSSGRRRGSLDQAVPLISITTSTAWSPRVMVDSQPLASTPGRSRRPRLAPISQGPGPLTEPSRVARPGGDPTSQPCRDHLPSQERGDGVADGVCIAGANLYADLISAGIQRLLAALRLRSEGESSWRVVPPFAGDVDLISRGPVDVHEVDVALGAGMHRAHRERRARPGPGQRQHDRSCLGQRVLRVFQAPNLGHHHDDVIGGVLSGSVRHT